jgi:hypothetical protein
MPRPRIRPISNTALAARIAETRQPFAVIAHEINNVNGENGRDTRYTGGSIGHWLTGTIPHPDTIPAAVEAFSRLLGRPELTAGDLGWHGPTQTPPPDPWRGDPITCIIQVGEADMLDRRSVLGVGIFSLAAMKVPRTLDSATARVNGDRRAFPGDIARIEQMTSQFAAMDDQFGGRHARVAVVAYLTRQVAPLLRRATGRARPALLRATAQLVYLAGFMASDDRQCGLAQRYLIQSVRLADEAQDLLARATALRALALQAVELGHPQQGLALADAAAGALPHKCPLRTRAWMTAMRAEAAAGTGDGRLARRLLHSAERDLERADSPPDQCWTGGFRRASFEHQAGTTMAKLGDLRSAESLLAASIAGRTDTERRSRVLIGSRLALLRIHLGRPEAAAHTLLPLDGDLALVASARADRELVRVRHEWRRNHGDPDIERADRLVASALRQNRHRP